MGRRIRPLLIMLFLLAAVVVSEGCSLKRQAVRQDGPDVSPPGESWQLGFVSGGEGGVPQEPFFSPVDNISHDLNRRWLTLFEVTSSPVGTGNLPKHDRRTVE